MFENVGEKIKVVAFIWFVILVIGAIVGAIILWVELEEFWSGFGTLVGGVGFAYINGLFLYGFGIIVDAHEGKGVGTSSAPAKKPAGTPLQGEWKCSKCGRINQNYVGTCGCGQRKP